MNLWPDIDLQAGDIVITAQGEALLVGDINTLGGTCDHCRYPGPLSMSPKNDVPIKVVRNSHTIWQAE